MIYTLKRFIHYSALPVALSLYCQPSYAAQMQLQITSETTFEHAIGEKHLRTYHVYHHGKELTDTELDALNHSARPTEQVLPISEQIASFTKQIEQLTKVMDVRSKIIISTTEQITSTSTQLEATSKQIDDFSSQLKDLQTKLEKQTGRTNRNVRKKTRAEIESLASQHKTSVENRAILASTLQMLLSKKQILENEQNNDGAQREFAKDEKVCAQVSQQFGSYSYSNKSSSETTTWKQMFGAIPEGLTQLGATLIRPFTDKLPGFSDVVNGAKSQKEKLSQEGVLPYSLGVAQAGVDLVGAGVQAVYENPLDVITMSLSLAMGRLDTPEASIIPSLLKASVVANHANPLVSYSIEIAPKVKEALVDEQKKIEAEGLINYLKTRGTNLGQTTLDFIQSDTAQLLATGAIGVGMVYFAGQMLELPGANAQYTPVLGTQYRINTNTVKTGADTVCLPNEACVTGWVDNSNNMIARIHIPKNGTFVTAELPISTSASTVTTTQALKPCLGAFNNGNWFMTWLQDSSTLVYRILTPSGSYVISPTQVNSAGETNVQPPSCAGLGTRGIIASANSSATQNTRYYVTFDSSGTLTTPSILDQSTTTPMATPRMTKLDNGNAYAFVGTTALQSTEIAPTGGEVGSRTSITISPALAITDPTGLVGGTGKDALLLGIPSGNTNLKGIAIPNGVPSSTQFTVHSGTTSIVGPSSAGSTDGNALAAFQTGDASLNLIVNGSLISPTGSLLSSEITISAPTLNGLGGPIVARIPTGGFSVTMGDGGDIYERMVTFTAPPTTSPTSSPTASPTSSGGTTAPSSTTGSPTGTTSPSSTTGPTSSGAPTNAPTSDASSLRSTSGYSALISGLSVLAALYWG